MRSRRTACGFNEFAPPAAAGPPDLRTVAQGAGYTMEHATGSGDDPAASSMPDHQTSPLPSAAAESSEPAEAHEAAEPAGMIESSETGAFSETAAPAETAGSAGTAGSAETAEDRVTVESNESGEHLATTGESRVDAALGRLGDLDEMPVSEHPGVYERIHEQLVDVLGELHQGTQSR
jgi:hypothetical protein